MEITAFISYGVKVAVQIAERELLPALVERFPPGARLTSPAQIDRLYVIETGAGKGNSGRREYVLLCEGHELLRSERVDDVLDSFESDSRLFIAEITTERVILHAGAVAWGNQGIIIPGRSYSGKTSLVAELVRSGAPYFSDEYAILDDDGLLHPYLKPLSIREGGANVQTSRPLDYFGGIAAAGPLPVGFVIVSEYYSGAVWSPKKLSAGTGMLALIDNSISIRRSPQKVLSTLGKVIAGVCVLSGTRGEASQVVEYLKKYYPPESAK